MKKKTKKLKVIAKKNPCRCGSQGAIKTCQPGSDFRIVNFREVIKYLDSVKG